MELIILFFPFLTKLAISDVIKFLDLAKFIDKSNNLETLSNIPPFFIASWIWEIFSNSPVTIPNVLFPNSKLLSCNLFINSFAEYLSTPFQSDIDLKLDPLKVTSPVFE